MLSAADEQRLPELRAETARTLGDVIGNIAHVAVLDYPSYENVGDSMIWAGEVQYLGDAGIRMRYTADPGTYDASELRRRHPDGPILLQGGGNLGDLWPRHQNHRERAIADFGDRRIVILPQSVHFQDPDNAARANRILGGHPDLTLLVREEQSMQRCREWLPDVQVRYCPDTAFGYRPKSSEVPTTQLFALARTDIESTGSLNDWLGRHPDVPRGDWSDRRRMSKVIWKGAVYTQGAYRRGGPTVKALSYRAVEASFALMLRQNLEFGRRLLSQGSVVITDRLHAHVLCVLLGIPHVVLDNNYGKISSIMRAYSGAFDTAVMVQDTSEISAAVASLTAALGKLA